MSGVFIIYLIIPVRGQTASNSAPYFSGAVNSHFAGPWLYNKEDQAILSALSAKDFYWYKFIPAADASNLIHYPLLPSGFLFFVMISNILFPFMGSIGSLVLLQLLIHIIASSLITRKIRSYSAKILFCFLYAINPAILFITLFPFYYFWQVLPSLFILTFILNKNVPFWISFLIKVPLSALIFITRPSTLPIILFTNLFFREKNRSFYFANIISFAILSIFLQSKSSTSYNGWHSAIAGMGAYPHDMHVPLHFKDGTVFDLYKSKTGVQISWDAEGNLCNDENVRIDYMKFCKVEYFSLLKEYPLTAIRNAALNFFQSFSVGYISRIPFSAQLLVAFSGMIVILHFIREKNTFRY